MDISTISFPDDIESAHPNSCLGTHDHLEYIIKFPTDYLYSGFRTAVTNLREGRNYGHLVDIAKGIDPSLDMKSKYSEDPLAMVLLNMDYFWAEWGNMREGIKVRQYTDPDKEGHSPECIGFLYEHPVISYTYLTKHMLNKNCHPLLYTLEVNKKEASLPFKPGLPQYFIKKYDKFGCVSDMRINVRYANNESVRNAIRSIRRQPFQTDIWALTDLNYSPDFQYIVEIMLTLNNIHRRWQKFNPDIEPPLKVLYSPITGLPEGVIPEWIIHSAVSLS